MEGVANCHRAMIENSLLKAYEMTEILLSGENYLQRQRDGKYYFGVLLRQGVFQCSEKRAIQGRPRRVSPTYT